MKNENPYINLVVTCNNCGYFAYHTCKENEIPVKCFDCRSEDLDCEEIQLKEE